MRLLLLSNSSSPDQPYLAHARDWIDAALGDARHVVFIPYAAVTVSYDEYAARVREALGRDIRSVHEADAPPREVHAADAVLVGGGNTFHLLRLLYRRGLIEPLRRHARAGKPFVGWSAGSNVAGPTIRTTNDMPIVEPPSLDALGLVPVQINPHYTDALPPGHQGETRAQRLAEFVAVNPGLPVLALPEGTALRVDGARREVLGAPPARVFAPDAPLGRDLRAGDLDTLLG
jgi:dipeptidase E